MIYSLRLPDGSPQYGPTCPLPLPPGEVPTGEWVLAGPEHVNVEVFAGVAYPVVHDAEAESHGMLRILDESGHTYLYLRELFVTVDRPSASAPTS